MIVYVLVPMSMQLLSQNVGHYWVTFVSRCLNHIIEYITKQEDSCKSVLP